nr:MAG TPA: hypothetical protein [Caudoviricetes sp.]
MKKFAKLIESVGALLFFLGISVDVVDNPITAVPALIGLLLIYLGTKIEGGWTEAEEIVEDHVFKDEETDDGIIYICDSNEDKEKFPYYKEVMKKKRNHPNRPKLNDSQSKQ